MPLSSSAREKKVVAFDLQLLPGTNEHVIPECDQWAQVTHGGWKMGVKR